MIATNELASSNNISPIKRTNTNLVRLFSPKEILLSAYIFFSFWTIWTLDIGFHIKPYMVTMLIAAPFVLNKLSKKLSTFELFFILLLCYFVFHTAIVSKNVQASSRMILGMSLVFLYYSVSKAIFRRYYYLTDQALHISGWCLTLFSIALYALGIWENHLSGALPRMSWGVMYERDLYRLTGVWTDPNFAALGMILIFFYALLWGKVRPFMAVASLLAFALCLSRGALVAGVAGLCTAVMFQLLAGRIQKRQLCFGGAVMISAVVLAAFAWQWPDIREVILHRVGNISSGSGRTELWLSGLAVWSANPMAGVGLYNFGSAIGEPGRFAHNTPLELLVEGGLPALILYVLFALSTLWHATRTNHAAFFIAVASAFFVMSLTLSMLIYEGIFLLFALMAVDVGSDHAFKKLRN